MKRKTLIIIMGACAAGKSTLGRALLEANGAGVQENMRSFIVQRKNRAQELQPLSEERTRYCISDNGIAVAGNRTGGSDCINSRAALTTLTDWLLKMNSVRAVIVNSVRFSQTSDIFDIAKRKDIRPLYVVYMLSEEENRRRLIQRRKGEPLSEKQEANRHRFWYANARNWEVLNQTYGPNLNAVVAEDRHTVKQITARVLRSL